MNKKNILIAVLGAIVLGALLGLAIGFVGGFFTSSNNEVQTSVTEQKTSVEEENAKKAEAEKDAKKAAQEAKEEENSSSEKTTTEKKDSQSADKTDESADSDNTDKKTTEGIGTGTVATGGAGLNLRSDASTDSNIVGTVNNGDTLTIIAESNGFYQVQTSGGQTAWVSSQFVTMS
ncbi:MAG: SH3 domain-containing protein [Peptococcaceae bacterium]|nr:SH3 domain-containing protein [Peptococcaceae bacterium]